MAEADSWLGDRKPLLTSEDHGKDESSTAVLLQRHLRLEKELAAYGSEIKRLSEQARSAAQLTALTVSINSNHPLCLCGCEGWEKCTSGCVGTIRLVTAAIKGPALVGCGLHSFTIQHMQNKYKIGSAA